jgi:hypothetical protein
VKSSIHSFRLYLLEGTYPLTFVVLASLIANLLYDIYY